MIFLVCSLSVCSGDLNGHPQRKFKWISKQNFHLIMESEGWATYFVSYVYSLEYIMLTCPCNEDPLTPHFYIVKLGFTGVYIFFLFLLQNIDCGYSLDPPH